MSFFPVKKNGKSDKLLKKYMKLAAKNLKADILPLPEKATTKNEARHLGGHCKPVMPTQPTHLTACCMSKVSGLVQTPAKHLTDEKAVMIGFRCCIYYRYSEFKI